jgi:hypothetical protein
LPLLKARRGYTPEVNLFAERTADQERQPDGSATLEGALRDTHLIVRAMSCWSR